MQHIALVPDIDFGPHGIAQVLNFFAPLKSAGSKFLL